jgi:hypothetical protein
MILEKGDTMKLLKTNVTSVAALLLVFLLSGAEAADHKPNILVIWGDEIGWYNISAYNLGVMGYRTPNSHYHHESAE